jgi:hypothetical protein
MTYHARSARPVLAAVLLLATSAMAAGPYPIIDLDPTKVSPNPGPGQVEGFNESHHNGMMGWTFHINETMPVAQVGFYDEGLNGLSRAFQVGLWRDDSGSYFGPLSTPTALLGAAGLTIPAGMAAPLNGPYRVVNLPNALNLLPGDYELAFLDTATTPDVVKYTMDASSNPRVTIRQFIWSFNSPNPSFGVVKSNGFYLLNGVEIGPMLFSTVPEPSSALLLFFAGAAAANRRRRGRSSRVHG